MQKRSFMAVALLFLLTSFATFAQDVPTHTIRGGIAYHMPDAEETVEIDELGSLDIEADDATGFFLAYEARFSKLLGLEIFATRAEPEFESILDEIEGPIEAISQTGKTDVEFNAVTAGLNVHVFGRGAVDLYVAPLFGYAFFGDTFEDDIVYGAGVGLDVGFGKRGLAFTASVRYLKSKAEAEDEENVELDLDPLIISAGLAYRF